MNKKIATLCKLYKQGDISLREAAAALNISQIDMMNLFMETGIKGNLDKSEVLRSLNNFNTQDI